MGEKEKTMDTDNGAVIARGQGGWEAEEGKGGTW